MKTTDFGKLLTGVAAATVVAFGFAYAQQGPRGKSSYMQVEINPENLERIFDAFFTTKTDGLGMGPIGSAARSSTRMGTLSHIALLTGVRILILMRHLLLIGGGPIRSRLRLNQALLQPIQVTRSQPKN